MCVCDDITQAGYAIGNYCINTKLIICVILIRMFLTFSWCNVIIPPLNYIARAT